MPWSGGRGPGVVDVVPGQWSRDRSPGDVVPGTWSRGRGPGAVFSVNVVLGACTLGRAPWGVAPGLCSWGSGPVAVVPEPSKSVRAAHWMYQGVSRESREPPCTGSCFGACRGRDREKAPARHIGCTGGVPGAFLSRMSLGLFYDSVWKFKT